ncbi:MAG: polysaccharide biosynthesis C-terminal domain-containing protein [Candidatus Methanomethylophilaceae archaeon]|nr:polysaccharide biosynthesis C-terminal domain-containing protein [Candidatus Methanomethylophilaceae archaeon]
MSKEDDLKRMLGEPKAAIRAMILPFFIALAVVEVNQFVDTYWVSGLGVNSASAVSTIVPIYGLMTCAGIGVAAGITATAASRLARGEYEIAGRLVSNSIILGLIFAVISSVLVAIFLNPVIDLMGADSVREEAIQYMIPYIVLSPTITIIAILGGTLRAEGAATKSTVIQSISAILNMVIDPIFIYVMDMGVFGAGLSTVISSLIAIVIGLYWYVSNRTIIPMNRSTFRIDKEAMREVLGVGGPKSIQMVISNLTDFLQRIFLIIAGGTTAVMLYNYTWRYIGMVGLPGRAVDMAMLPVCSAAYGVKDVERMKAGFIYSSKLVIGAGIIFAIILFIFAEPFMSIMTQEESMHEILDMFVWTLRASVLLIPFSAMMGVASSMLQSMKKAKIPMYYYMFWGFVKLGLYALAAYGLFGIDPFEGIIYCMVGVHIFGAACLIYLAYREYDRIKKEVMLHNIDEEVEMI